MRLCKAMNEASSEHIVFFLTTAYIESLQHLDCARALPAHLTSLPLDGTGDLKRRCDVVRALIVVYHPHDGGTDTVLAEARDVFETALRRLRALSAQETVVG